MTMLADEADVVIGVDTHKLTNTAAIVLSATGGVLEQVTTPTCRAGYTGLLARASIHGDVRVWAIEGTNSYRAGLTRFLRANGERVIELDRPARTKRRGGKKSDPLDAVRAAREALSRSELGEPRTMGDRGALSVLLAARRSAVEARTAAQRQVHALIVAAPEGLRARFSGRTSRQVLNLAIRLRVCAHHDTETKVTITVLRSLARGIAELEAETEAHERAVTELVRAWRPDLLDLCGVGPIVAATVLCAWSHSGRFRSEGAFASLAGVAPIPASSDLIVRNRLNRRGDRQLNRALHVVVINRLRHDKATHTSTVGAGRERATGRSSGASSAMSPGSCSVSSKQLLRDLTAYRSVPLCRSSCGQPTCSTGDAGDRQRTKLSPNCP